MNSNPTCIGQMVRRMLEDEKYEAYHPDSISPTVNQMVWQSISKNGVGRQNFITGTANESVYTDICDEFLKPVIGIILKLEKNVFLMRFCHMAKSISITQLIHVIFCCAICRFLFQQRNSYYKSVVLYISPLLLQVYMRKKIVLKFLTVIELVLILIPLKFFFIYNGH